MLGPGAEFDAVRDLVARWGARASGIGDDGALLDVPVDHRLVVSVDALVEGVHFRRNWLTPVELGWRATMGALSDLAAMGARPLALLPAIALPVSWRSSLGSIGDGIGEAAAATNALIAGGNITSAGELSITTVVLGTVQRPLQRGGARPGDAVYVTGSLGGPILALRAFALEREPPTAARVRFARPVARVRAGLWLAAHGATSAIDLSDGLGSDTWHVAAASGVTIRLEWEAIPRFAGASTEDALTSGEEFELLVTLPESDAVQIAAAFARELGAPFTRIGVVQSTGDADVVLYRDGARVALPAGYDHLSR
ncbi:MAG: thiamine-phosphate kinase [Gemmatimonadaceae bacterium]